MFDCKMWVRLAALCFSTDYQLHVSKYHSRDSHHSKSYKLLQHSVLWCFSWLRWNIQHIYYCLAFKKKSTLCSFSLSLNILKLWKLLNSANKYDRTFWSSCFPSALQPHSLRGSFKKKQVWKLKSYYLKLIQLICLLCVCNVIAIDGKGPHQLYWWRADDI